MDIINRILDPLMLSDFVKVITVILSMIPTPMGILVTLAVVFFVIRAIF